MSLPPLPPPTQIILGADIWRDDGSAAPLAPDQAVAIRGNRIAAVGPREEIRKAFPGATVITLPGGTLLPGFIEGHAHVEAIGQQKLSADLTGAASLQEALSRAGAWAKAHPAPWLQGRGWDQNLWPSKTFPTAADLDAVTGSTPAVMERVDGHALWVNSAALAAAGITRNTPDPSGGTIVRDAKGQPTGILLDAAMAKVTHHIPALTAAQREACVMDGLSELRRLGFTSVADMGTDQATLETYRRLDRQHRLPIRVFAYLTASGPLMLQEFRHPRSKTTAFLQVQGVKFFLDGALGSRGARMLTPYADAPGSQGLWVGDPVKMAKDIKVTLRAGYQPAIHAIGDAANRKALEMLPRTAPKGLAPRIEHAQIVTPADAAEFGRKGVIASVQPIHCTDDHAWTPARLGPDRLQEAFPWRAFLQGGAVLALGSDAPIADANPFKGIASAETRQDAQGQPEGGFIPSQRLTRPEALRGYLTGNARALGRPELGALKAGGLADLLWVQAPLLTLSPSELRKVKPARMWVNGKEVQP